MQPGTERRGQPRVHADLPIQLALDGGATDANIRDISISGVCCETNCAVPVMTQVRLTIVLPDLLPDVLTEQSGEQQPISCAGAVVRSIALPENGSDSFETAIFFTQMGESDRANLEDFIALRQAAGAAAPDFEG